MELLIGQALFVAVIVGLPVAVLASAIAGILVGSARRSPEPRAAE
jgi:hypothetical protein